MKWARGGWWSCKNNEDASHEIRPSERIWTLNPYLNPKGDSSAFVRLAWPLFGALESVGQNFSPALSWPQIWSLFWRRDSVGTNFAPDAVMFMSLLVLSFSFGTLLGAVFKPFPQYNQVLSFSFGKLCGAVFKPFPQYNEVLSLSFGMLLGAVFKPFPQYNQVLSFSFWTLLGAASFPAI